ncbi:MAG: hypothetical protein IPJ39_12540 [Saprospiraceae bacterium]|nr:hypothetical protein [Saprospiraceae bacterium]
MHKIRCWPEMYSEESFRRGTFKAGPKDLHQFMVEGLTDRAMDSFDIAGHGRLFDKNTGITIFRRQPLFSYNKL